MEPTSNQILHQLNSILESPAFKASDLLSKFLVYVVEQSIAGNNQNIKAYNIAVDAFGREPGFDPQSDSIVRITASKLRKELQHYYSEYGVSDTVLIEIPKGKYIPGFSLITAQPSTVSELVNSSNNKRSINIYRLVIILFVLLVLTVIVIKFSPQPNIQNERPVIILYEFQNLTPDINNNHWVFGFSEEIAVLCSRFAEIDIIGPVLYADSGEQEQSIQETANTDNLFALEGSVVALDSILKVNVRLVDFQTSKIIWAKTIQKEIGPESLMDIEYEISNSIAAKVSSIYGVVQNEVMKKSTSGKPASLSSHLSVLKFFQYLRNFAYKDYIKTKQELINTTIDDPKYGLAWSALATLYMDGYMYFGEDSTESFSNANACLSKALEIEPDNVFVQSHRVYYSFVNRNLVDFYDAVKKEESLNPSNIMIGEMGVFLVLIGDSEKGLKLIEEAQNMTLVYPGYFHGGTFIHYFRKGEFEKALVEAELINMPEYFIDPLFRAVALINLNKKAEARLAKKEVLESIPNFSNDGSAVLRRILYLENDVHLIMNDFKRID